MTHHIFSPLPPPWKKKHKQKKQQKTATPLFGLKTTRWWLNQPIWTILYIIYIIVKLDHFPNFRDENNKYLKKIMGFHENSRR